VVQEHHTVYLELPPTVANFTFSLRWAKIAYSVSGSVAAVLTAAFFAAFFAAAFFAGF
jgi:hypothetical protein